MLFPPLFSRNKAKYSAWDAPSRRLWKGVTDLRTDRYTLYRDATAHLREIIGAEKKNLLNTWRWSLSKRSNGTSVTKRSEGKDGCSDQTKWNKWCQQLTSIHWKRSKSRSLITPYALTNGNRIEFEGRFKGLSPQRNLRDRIGEMYQKQLLLSIRQRQLKINFFF